MNNNNLLRIGVLMGGRGIEREVSFNSARTICDHIDTSCYSVVPIFQRRTGELFILPLRFLHRGKTSDFEERLQIEAQSIVWDDLPQLIDFAFIAMHGRFAEDGTLQGALEVLGIPYLGSGVLASTFSMDKVRQKMMLQHAGIAVPPGFVVTPDVLKSPDLASWLAAQLAEAQLTFPLIVKPAEEGSSLGISVVNALEELLPAVRAAATCDERFLQSALVEQKIKGMEFTYIHLQNVATKSRLCGSNPFFSRDPAARWLPLPITEVVPEDPNGIFDYEQKYMPGRARKITPARCSEEMHQKIAATCSRVADVLNFRTLSRIDGFATADGRVVIIDANTLSGMGPATFIFHQAAEVNISHTQLINYFIESDLQRYGVALRGVNDDQLTGDSVHKTRVVVLLGGNSHEREISLESGRNVCYKLSPHKYEVIPVFVREDMKLFRLSQRLLIQNSTREIAQLVTDHMQVKWSDLPKLCDFVFIGLHGGQGENGGVQGMFEMLDLPYNGSGVFASALCMDKFKANQFLAQQGFATPIDRLVDKNTWESLVGSEARSEFLRAQLEGIPLPVVVKPPDDGCSVLVSKVETLDELSKTLDQFFTHDKSVAMIENALRGVELTCGVVGNSEPRALPPSQPYVSRGVLSLQEKFLPGAGENQTPAPLPGPALKFVMRTMEEVYKAIGCAGYVRIDCFYQDAQTSDTGTERVVILEINSLPALTPATCLFHQAAEIGLSPMAFIEHIIQLGFEQHRPAVALRPAGDAQQQECSS